MKKSKCSEPFTEEEKTELSTKPKLNDFIKGAEGTSIKGRDWRLTYRQGRQIIVKDRNFKGSGVKTMQITLSEEGLKKLEAELTKCEECAE